MTENSVKLSKLSQLLDLAVKLKTRSGDAYSEAFNRTLEKLQLEMRTECDFYKQQQLEKKQWEDKQKEVKKKKLKELKEAKESLEKQIEEKEQEKQKSKPQELTELNGLLNQRTQPYLEMQHAYKEVLDSQVAEKKETQQKNQTLERQEDLKYLKNATAGLHQELQESLEKKHQNQEELIQSWKETQLLNEFQKELEKIRLYGVKEDSQHSQDSEAKELRREQVLKRIQKLFGKKKTQKSTDSGSYRSKSVVSRFSTPSEAQERLQELEEEEKRIQKEKEELQRLMELKSCSSKQPSRVTTVASMASRQSYRLPKLKEPGFRFSRRSTSKYSETQPLPQIKPKSQQPQQDSKSQKHDEVRDLIYSLPQ